MAEAYATKKTATGFLSPTMYAQVTGIAVLGVAVLGLFLDDLFGAEFIAFDATHTTLHFVLAAIALAAGFVGGLADYRVLYAKAFGVVYTGLGVAGFFWPDGGVAGLGLEIGENLIHLAIGVWGLLAGFMSGS